MAKGCQCDQGMSWGGDGTDKPSCTQRIEHLEAELEAARERAEELAQQIEGGNESKLSPEKIRQAFGIEGGTARQGTTTAAMVGSPERCAQPQWEVDAEQMASSLRASRKEKARVEAELEAARALLHTLAQEAGLDPESSVMTEVAKLDAPGEEGLEPIETEPLTANPGPPPFAPREEG